MAKAKHMRTSSLVNVLKEERRAMQSMMDTEVDSARLYARGGLHVIDEIIYRLDLRENVDEPTPDPILGAGKAD